MNIAEKAWAKVKDANDPVWGGLELSFRENLQFRADKVKETGTAITNFEKMVAKMLSEETGSDDSPMAVVEAPAGVDYEAAAEGLVEKKVEKKVEKAADKPLGAPKTADKPLVAPFGAPKDAPKDALAAKIEADKTSPLK